RGARLVQALPGDDEVAVRVRPDRRGDLLVGGEGVDVDLATQGRTGGAVALRVDAVVGAALLEGALPGDHERPVGGQRDGRDVLRARRHAVDPEFAAQHGAGG